MSSISRRSIAKGAAWTIPAVTVAGSAPATAASTDCVDSVVTPANPMTLQAGSSFGATMLAGDGTYKNGTFYSLGLGQWNVPPVTYTHTCPGKADETLTATGYYLQFGSAATNVTTKNGTAYQGKVTGYTPTGGSPQTAGAGLSESLYLQTSVPYNGLLTCSSAHTLGTVSIPFQIVYLDGLTPLNLSKDTPQQTYMLNLDFKNSTACSPQIGATYTITKA